MPGLTYKLPLTRCLLDINNKPLIIEGTSAFLTVKTVVLDALLNETNLLMDRDSKVLRWRLAKIIASCKDDLNIAPPDFEMVQKLCENRFTPLIFGRLLDIFIDMAQETMNLSQQMAANAETMNELAKE